MGQYPVNFPYPSVRPRPNVWDDVGLPRQAADAARAWADRFARLPKAEQRAMVTRLTVATIRYQARKRGYPEPHIVLAVMRLAADGHSFEVDHYEPLPVELGGTGEWPEGFDPATLAANPPPLAGLPKKRRSG